MPFQNVAVQGVGGSPRYHFVRKKECQKHLLQKNAEFDGECFLKLQELIEISLLKKFTSGHRATHL